MKKIILLALVTLIMTGCIEKSTHTSYHLSIKPKELSGIRIYIVDSCEYIGRGVGFREGILAHKGNCRFYKERRKQELEALVEQIKEK